jgi:hypothetical protein
MLSKKTFAPVFMAFALLLLAVVALTYIPAGRVDAAPAAIPTPVIVGFSGDNTEIKTFWSAQRLIADGGSAVFEMPQAEALDIQYTIDQTVVVATSETNTTTLKLQFSNDGTNWTDGVNVVASNATDVTNLLQFNNFGRYTRVFADVTNVNPVTFTVIAVARR